MSQLTKSRRAMVALVALADLPMPQAIRFVGDILSLDVDAVAEGQAWSQFLGGETDTYIHDDGRRYLREGTIRWHGWSVQIHASDPPSVAGGGELDPETVAALEAIAENGGETQ